MNQTELCGKDNAMTLQQTESYLPLFQNSKTARDWKLKETRHIIPETKCASLKRLSNCQRLPVQFYIHFPSDTNRTTFLDPVAAADIADTADITDTADIADITDTADIADITDTADIADTADTTGIADTADIADTANIADTADIHNVTVRNIYCPVTIQQ